MDGLMGRIVNNDDQRFSYTAEELRVLKLAHVESECVIDSDSIEIRRGMKFNSLELQFFLADYAVRHHRPFNVVHSDKRVCYDVLCKQGCLWVFGYILLEALVSGRSPM